MIAFDPLVRSISSNFTARLSVYRNDIIGGVCMPNMKYLTLTVEKLQRRLTLTRDIQANRQTEMTKHYLRYLSIFAQLRWVLEETPTHSGKPGVKVSNECPWWYIVHAIVISSAVEWSG